MVMNRDLTWSDEHIILCADEGVHLKPINLINQCHPSKFIKKKGEGEEEYMFDKTGKGVAEFHEQENNDECF